MGKSFPSSKARLKQLTNKTASQFLNRTPKQTQPTSQTRSASEVQVKDNDLKKMEDAGSSVSSNSISESMRMPLSEVVSDCVKRWFKDTLKEAKAGDINMQVLGRIWIFRASTIRSSVWKIGEKHPGYNASDSDSDEMNEES